MEGNTYRNRQGDGYATTFNRSGALDVAAKQEALGGQKKAKDRAAGAKASMDYKPEEVWHFYGAEANGAFNSWMDEGAKIMANKDIPNLWNSTDEEAIDWQIKAGRIAQANENITQAKEMYEKAMQNIGSRGDEYTEEYLQSVRDFPVNVSFDEMASGEFQFPQAQYKNPSKIYSDFFVKDSKILKGELDGAPPTDDQLSNRVETYFSSPENERDVVAAKQMYDRLPATVQMKYKAKAELKGFDEPWMGLVFDNYKNQFNTTPANLQNDVMEYAKIAPKDYNQWSKEDTAGVTISGSAERLADNDFAKNVATSHFAEKSYLLDDEGYMSQMDIPMTLTRMRRKELAIERMSERVEANITFKKESKVSREGSNGLGDKEIGESFDLWRERIGSFDQTAANEAANWLFGTKGPDGVVESARVLMESAAPTENPITGVKFELPHRVLVVDYKDAKEASKAVETFYKKALDEGFGPDSEYDDNLQKLMEHYKSQSKGDRVFFPVVPENEQMLKQLHDVTAKTRKAKYEPEYNPSTSSEATPSPWDNLGN